MWTLKNAQGSTLCNFREKPTRFEIEIAALNAHLISYKTSAITLELCSPGNSTGASFRLKLSLQIKAQAQLRGLC